MKRLVVILFFVFSVMAYSQPTFLCSDGSPANSLLVSLPVTIGPNCATGNILVYYCCDIDPVTGKLTIDLKGAQIMDWRCFAGYDFSDQAFWNIVRDALISEMITNPSAPCHINPNSIGNCNNPTIIHDFIRNGCWQLVSYFGSQSTHLIPCGEGYCETAFEYCYDYSEVPPVLRRNIVSTGGYGNICPPGTLIPFENVEINPEGPIVPFDETSPCVLTCGGQ